VKAKDLVTWGIATHFVPQAKLPDLVKSIVSEVNAGSSDQNIIDLVNKHSEITASDAKIPDYDEIR
jgi:hypothetical protein